MCCGSLSYSRGRICNSGLGEIKVLTTSAASVEIAEHDSRTRRTMAAARPGDVTDIASAAPPGQIVDAGIEGK
jgi:hypothetical protein